ncbi:hypothetical protein JYT16_02065, partial [Gemmatimonas aurantiaca]|nr:hypothetical protein [Gemmatimonas aurantiaca]
MARILHLGWAFSPHVSRWLIAQRDMGHDIHLISYGGDDSQNLAGISTHIIPRSSLGKLGYLMAVGQVCRIAERIQ